MATSNLWNWKPALAATCAIVAFAAARAACAQEIQKDAPRPVLVRFLLTFDDGPSAVRQDNSTRSILDQLDRNKIQPHIKAVFFVQTRNPNGGGSVIGRELLQREHADGHLIELHSGSPRGHINHTQMPWPEFVQSLKDGIADIESVTGSAPEFVRPPFWAFNAYTLAGYQEHNLRMLLDDVTIGDGKVHGVIVNFHARNRMRIDLRNMYRKIQAGKIPEVAGHYPIVVTFHDTNPYTASHLQPYLEMLVEEAWRAGMTLDNQYFYGRTTDIETIISARATTSMNTALAAMKGVHSYKYQ
ncbi:MAG: polysaccharide deacetylase family protein [Acidiferrobacterales bacterium]